MINSPPSIKEEDVSSYDDKSEDISRTDMWVPSFRISLQRFAFAFGNVEETSGYGKSILCIKNDVQNGVALHTPGALRDISAHSMPQVVS